MRWIKDDRQLDNSAKYRVEKYTYDEEDEVTMTLRIQDVQNEDFGDFRCVASTADGRGEDLVHLYGEYVCIRTSL